MRALFSRVQQLSPLQLTLVAVHKVRQRLLVEGERRGGAWKLTESGVQWASRWTKHTGEQRISSWLERPGSGEFFIAPKEAPAWCESTCTEADEQLASSTASGVFDLIGSGPVQLGTPPSWLTDLYSGRKWPGCFYADIPLYAPDGSDIRTVWELSRGYHLPALAKAYWRTRNTKFLSAYKMHLTSWSEQNPLCRGPHWASPMDVAIRCSNWILSLILFSKAIDEDVEFTGAILANLHSSGSFLERHLEWHPTYRGNHYVANAVGLVYLGALFRGTRHGDRWLDMGARILSDELLSQVTADGVSFESSLAYHRLVTELFGYGGDVVKRNAPGFWCQDQEDRLQAMNNFIEAYLPPSGLAPVMGDADDGRLHVLAARELSEPRRHSPTRLQPRRQPNDIGSMAFVRGGFFIIQDADDHAIVRCGRVGLNGAGSHDHNDQLSFELVIAGHRIVSDSGTFSYADAASRHQFRSTAAHSVVQLGNAEQNPILPNERWRIWADRTRARCTEWHVGDAHISFGGEHFGYAHLDCHAIVARRLTFDRNTRAWTIEDTIDGVGDEHITWRLHLGSNVKISELKRRDGSLVVTLTAGGRDVLVTIDSPCSLDPAVIPTAESNSYHQQTLRPCLVLSGRASLPAAITCALAPMGTAAFKT
jgi:hypothetical protein